MRSIRIHPLFWALLLIFSLMGKLLEACSALLAVFIHEWAHYKVAASRGYKLGELMLMPYGALLYTEENMHKQDAFYIASAGIVTNLLLCTLIMASWWLIPSTYPVTHMLYNANFALAVFNLLPAYPLDGARIILALSKRPIKTLNKLKKIGTIISILMFISFITSFFFEFNITLGIAAISLFFGARFGTEKQTYLFVSAGNPFEKEIKQPIEEATICVDKDLQLKKIYPYFNKNKRLTIKITDGDTTLATYNESEFISRLSGLASCEKAGMLLLSPAEQK